jgi:hypothetical protein
MAPFIGGFIATSHLGWRWTEYLTGILVGTDEFGLMHADYLRLLLRLSWTSFS